MTDWSTYSAAEALETLRSDPDRGLSQQEAAARQQDFGLNELQGQQLLPLWKRFLGQFREFLVLLLVGAAVISLLLGEITDALVIMIVVTVNAVLGLIQEYRAEKALEALKNLSAPTAKVVRDGQVAEVPARELVPGDVVFLDAGDFVPADGRLLESANLKVDQSALTGESEPVEKNDAFIAVEDTPLAERDNMIHMGTSVSFGRGKILVTGTGMATEIGRIAGLIGEDGEEQTPLQKKLGKFGQQLGMLGIFFCIIIFLLGVLRGSSFYEMFLIAVSLAVAAIPEGLPAIVTVVLALGVQRMARQNAIIRKLPAVETLGAATVICSDKTGTITQNAMTVRKLVAGCGDFRVTGEGYNTAGRFFREDEAGETIEIEPASDAHLSLLLKIALLNNDARLTKEEAVNVIGDPTEGALVVAAGKAGLTRERLERELPRIGELPFDSERKMMSTIHRGVLREWPGDNKETRFLLTKGAPGEVLEKCSHWVSTEGIRKLDLLAKEHFLAKNREMARQALRVLAFALRPLEEASVAAPDAETDLVFVGMAGMMDPPRPEAGQALETSRRAGIKVKMITGDHRDTALAIAREMNLAHDDTDAISGTELDRLEFKELQERVKTVSVFARVSPEHKVRIVEALQANGDIVAMTGDGVNDAPALRKADIGISMGQTGTDVAKEAAEMVLADDNFATIVKAVQEGRIIFENIKKAIYFLLSTNMGELFTILGAILLGWPLPLFPIQVLWINLVTDSLPALAIGVDPPERGAMQRPPRNPSEGIFEPGARAQIILFGLFIALVTLGAFWLGWRESTVKGQTLAFATLAFSQLVHVFNFRSLRESIFRRGIAGNRPLLAGVSISAALQIIVLVVPFFMPVFRVVSLSGGDWLTVIVLCLSPVAFGELWKLVVNRKTV